MGMGVKTDYVRNFFVTLFVLSSIVLSYVLWTAGRNVGTKEATTGQTTRSSVAQTSHQMSDTFRPTGIALHGEGEDYQVQFATSYPLRHLMRDIYGSQNLEEIDRSFIWTLEEYSNRLENGRWLELVYTEEQPIGLLDQKFVNLSSDFRNLFYNRILVNLEAPSRIYFYNTHTEWAYEASIVNEEVFDLGPFLDKENLDYQGSFPLMLEGNIVYLPYQELEIPYQSFVIDRFPDSIYIENFFPDTSQVDRRSQNGVTRYIDLTKEVTINQNNNTLNYLRQISDPDGLDPTSRFRRSFEQLNRFENWSDTFVLSHYNPQSHLLEFRREIDGYPVFDLTGNETISEVGVVESGVTNLKLPIRYINTPLSIQGSPTGTLLSGSELLNQLQVGLQGRALSEIQNVSIGYTWIESEEDSQVIYFNPDWYVQINDEWQTLETFLQISEVGEMNGF